MSLDVTNDQPALILTVYASRGALTSARALVDEWDREEQLDERTCLRLGPFACIDAHDSDFLQVALNGSGSARYAWATLRDRGARLVRRLEGAKIELRGYTLLYQAYEEEAQVRQALDELVAYAKPLSTDRPGLLAVDERPTGALALVRDRSAGGEDLSMVYIALLARGVARPEWGAQWFLGDKSAFFLPDLISHKGYDQIHQYRSSVEPYEARLTMLDEVTRVLVAEARASKAASRALEQAEGTYRDVQRVRTLFEKVQVSLEQQLANLAVFESKGVNGPVLAHHLSAIRTAVNELSFFVRKGRIAYESALLSLETVRTFLEKNESDRQDILQDAMGGLGAALAVPQIVTLDVAGELLMWLGVPCPATSVKVLTQVVLVVLFGGALIWLLRALRR